MDDFGAGFLFCFLVIAVLTVAVLLGRASKDCRHVPPPAAASSEAG